MKKHYDSSNKQSFYQVWNDSIVIADLIKSISINIALTTTFLYTSNYVLSTFVRDPHIMKGYSLLIGLLGCVLGAAICIKLYKPKRIINTEVENNDNLYAFVTELVDYDLTNSIANLPTVSKDEVIQLGLYDLFIKAEHEYQKELIEE